MKLSLFLLAASFAALGLGACAPSPYYTGTKGGLAPGAVPRDGMGRPVLAGKAVEYNLPPPAPAVTTDIAGRRTVASAANQVIYFEDLHYADKPGQVAGSRPQEQAHR